MTVTDPSAPARSTGRGWRVPVGLFVVLAAVYGATISSDPSPDVYSADFAGWHIARTGDPVPVISDFPALDRNIIRETWIVETADGRESVGRAPGVIAATVPAYWLLRPDGLTAAPGGVMAALVSAGTVTLFFLLLSRRLGGRPALTAALLLGVATPLWSVAADGMWPHTLTCFAVVGMAWAADRDRWWLVGLFGGVALWGRLHAAILCAVLGVLVAWWRRRPAIALRVALVSGGMLGLMTVWTHWMYGRWDPSSGYRAGDFTSNATRLDPVNLLGFWIAPDRGLLLWTPLLVLLAPALVRGWRDLPDWSRALLVSGTGYLLVQGLLVRFSGGDAFYAYRTSLEWVVSAAPALALSAQHLGERARRWFVPVALLQLAMIVPGAVVDDLGLPVAEVWHDHAFRHALEARPGVTVPLALLAVGAGLLYLRVVRTAWAGRLLD